MIGLHALKQFDSEATAMKFQSDALARNRSKKTRTTKFTADDGTMNHYDHESQLGEHLRHQLI